MSNVSYASLIVIVLSCTSMCIALIVASAQCFVCGTKAVVTFKPCYHAVICAGCAERVKKCPTCKVLYMYMYMYARCHVLHVYNYILSLLNIRNKSRVLHPYA